ncbi:MAG: heterodisulfide reductase-related iron-sulfur binding cluster [Bacteroidota bacterium]
MTLKATLFSLILLIAFSGFVYNIRRLLSYLKIGQKEDRRGNLSRRLKDVLVIALGQKKLLRDPLAGILHAAIFWGFLVLILAVIESIGAGVLAAFSLSFLGGVYSFIIFSQEIFCLFVAIAVIVSLYRRFVTHVPRLQVDRHGSMDAGAILCMIFVIVISLLLQNATRIASGKAAAGFDHPVSSLLVGLYSGVSSESVHIWSEIFWWIHIILILVFLNYLPYSKHLHVLTSIPNVYLSYRRSHPALKPINLEDEKLERFGALDVDDLTWKQLLDGYTCTECGRCTSVCPANITGKPLSPRKIMVDIRERLMEKAPTRIAGGDIPQDIAEKTLVHAHITDEEIWSCTTCMACMQECPVMIEHIDAIIDMRRGLVLMESQFPQELQSAFKNLETNFSPWAFSSSSRADWAEGLGVKTYAEKPDAKILYWVGCAGSYDARYKKVSQSFARLMQMAGVDFAILGTEEKCTGDPARRMGNEYLAQMLMKENIATFQKYHVQKIVTTCPHCLNTLKNEYPDFGGKYEVVHHSVFLEQLIAEGKLKLKKGIGGNTLPAGETRITFHDSCYLGRYNGTYDAPRNIIRHIQGVRIDEMNRTHDRGFCCGAGGGRMFMEENTGKRVNIERTEEALAVNPDIIGTACPFCMTMLVDGVKEKEAGEKVRIKDIAELVLEAAE